MNRRILLALGAFVIWTAITVIGGRLRAGGETELVEAVTQGVNWVYPLAAALLLAVVAWQRWDDVGLKTAPAAGSLRLLWLPALYIAVFLVLGVLLGLPPIAVIFFVLVNTFFVGLSEELMFRGILLQAFRHRMAIWPAILVTSLLFGGYPQSECLHHRSPADRCDPIGRGPAERALVHRHPVAHRVPVARHRRPWPVGFRRLYHGRRRWSAAGASDGPNQLPDLRTRAAGPAHRPLCPLAAAACGPHPCAARGLSQGRLTHLFGSLPGPFFMPPWGPHQNRGFTT